MKRIALFMIGLAVFGWVWERAKAPPLPGRGVSVSITVIAPTSDRYQLFYDSIGHGFGPAWSTAVDVIAHLDTQEVVFVLPAMKQLHGLRLDPGDRPTEMYLSSFRIYGPYRSLELGPQEFMQRFTVRNGIDSLIMDDELDAVLLRCTGTDPFLATGTDLTGLTNSTLSTVRPVLGPFVLAAVSAALVVLLLNWLFGVVPRPTLRPPWKQPWSYGGILMVGLCSGAIFFVVHALVSGIRIEESAQGLAVQGTFRANDDTQVFFAPVKDQFTKDALVARPLTGHSGVQYIRYAFPTHTDLHYLRFDPGMLQDTVWLDSFTFLVGDQRETWYATELRDRLVPNDHIAAMDTVDGRLRIITNGNDPNFKLKDDIAPIYTRLNAQAGNGPLPAVFASITALFFLLGSARSLARFVARPDVRTTDLLVAALFVFVITVPIVAMITGKEPAVANTEKRLLAVKPPYTLARTLVYPTEYATYYAENFGFRKLLFRWNALFKAHVLHTSPLPDRVIFGKDDWLFYMQADALQNYQGLCAIPDEKLRVLAERLEIRRQWLKAQGITYVLMFPPEKSAIYADMLPARIKRFNEASCLDRLITHLERYSQLDVVDIRGVLRDARKKRDVYYTTDTHWNPVGAWFGYAALMHTLRGHRPELGPPVPFEGYTIHTDTNDQGDLATMMAMNDVFTRVTPLMVPKDSLRAKEVRSGSYSGSGFLKYPSITKEVPGSTAPRLLMIRDSFAVYMIPSMSEHFSRSTYVWTPIFIPQIVAEERPDIIVHEVMELYLSDLLQDDLPLPPLP